MVGFEKGIFNRVLMRQPPSPQGSTSHRVSTLCSAGAGVRLVYVVLGPRGSGMHAELPKPPPTIATPPEVVCVGNV